MLSHRVQKFLVANSVRVILACQIHTSFASQTTMRAVRQHKFGGSSELYVSANETKPTAGDNQILIRVHATALNRADLLMREGKYPGMKETAHLGLEVSGVVDAVGEKANKWRIGDKVMALLSGGGYSEFAAVNQDHVMSIPQGFTFEKGAAIPEVWLTAYQLLHFVGNLQKGETVLIHGGGSGVGTAAVQLVTLAGAKAIVTAGTDEKIAFAKKLGAMDGFNYKKSEFKDHVLGATNGKGVNVILDCVGGSYWEQNAACLAVEGRWVVYGLLGGPNVNGPILGTVLRKRASILGTTLKARSDEYKASLIKAFADNALPHFEAGTTGKVLQPVIDRILSLDNIIDAHDYMATNKSNGKIVITVQEDLDTQKSEL
ncbi:quinone oxidoreductase PIG3-like [Ciona intestinalis]